MHTQQQVYAVTAATAARPHGGQMDAHRLRYGGLVPRETTHPLPLSRVRRPQCEMRRREAVGRDHNAASSCASRACRTVRSHARHAVSGCPTARRWWWASTSLARNDSNGPGGTARGSETRNVPLTPTSGSHSLFWPNVTTICPLGSLTVIGVLRSITIVELIASGIGCTSLMVRSSTGVAVQQRQGAPPTDPCAHQRRGFVVGLHERDPGSVGGSPTPIRAGTSGVDVVGLRDSRSQGWPAHGCLGDHPSTRVP